MVAVGPCDEAVVVKSVIRELPFVGLANMVAEGGGGIPEEKGEGAAMVEGGGATELEDTDGREEG